jgi:monofunctional biosynthetic peptidoglycan transglycosylase
VRILLVLLLVDLAYLYAIWPDWTRIAQGPVPQSSFMSAYERQRAEEPDWPPLRWQPVPFEAIPKYVTRAVILAEDSRFYEHSGFDLIAFKEAMDYNLAEGRLVFGASTISQQTAKNLFLSPARNPVRKWHELILTWAMEQRLAKRRILEIYLNVAEFGQGIYGVQAAARAYWGVDVGSLTPLQAAELAATLPSPLKNNPATRTSRFERRARRIHALLLRYPGEAAASVHGETAAPGQDRAL